jgi:microcystin-dependent protein
MLLTYGIPATVIGDDNNLYSSLQAANTGNTPSTSPEWWGPVTTVDATEPQDVVPLSQVEYLITTAITAISAVEIGKVSFFPVTTAPANYLKANGAAVSRTAYASLFAQVGTTFGAGDGSTTFNLPDVRGSFLRAFDDGKGLDPSRVLGTYQADGYASHNHPITDPTHAHSVSDPTHNHAHSDPGHGHGVSDPQHSHSANGGTFTVLDGNGGGNGLGSGGQAYSFPSNTNAAATGIGVNAATSNVSNVGAATGIGIYGSATGITVNANGGTETRPKNMSFLGCIRYQ